MSASQEVRFLFSSTPQWLDEIELPSSRSYLTDDFALYRALAAKGLPCTQIRRAFDYGDPRRHAVYQRAIEQRDHIMRRLPQSAFADVDIWTGWKYHILETCFFFQQLLELIDDLPGTISIILQGSDQRYLGLANILERRGRPVETARLDDGNLLAVERPSRLASPPARPSPGLRQAPHNLGDSLESRALRVPVLAFIHDSGTGFYVKHVIPPIRELSARGQIRCYTYYDYGREALEKNNIPSTSLDLFASDDKLQAWEFHYRAFTELGQKTDDVGLTEVLRTFLNDRFLLDAARFLNLIRITLGLLRDHRPAAVLVAPDGTAENDVICETCRVNGVKTVSVVPDINGSYRRFGALYQADRLCVAGPLMQRQLEALGIPASRLALTGAPGYDDLCRTKVSRRSGAHLVVVAMSRIHGNENEWMSGLIRGGAARGWQTAIKFHPGSWATPAERQYLEELSEQLKRQCGGIDYQIGVDLNLNALLGSAGVLITEYSAVAVEGSLREVPVIIFAPREFTWHDGPPFSIKYHRQGAGVYCSGLPELLDLVEAYLRDDRLRDQLQKSQKEFNLQINYLCDGKANDRVVAELR